MTKIDTLIISPHCDDEVLGCGGILHNRKDIKTFVYYLGIDIHHVITRAERINEVDAVSKFLNFDYRKEEPSTCSNDHNYPRGKLQIDKHHEGNDGQCSILRSLHTADQHGLNESRQQ